MQIFCLFKKVCILYSLFFYREKVERTNLKSSFVVAVLVLLAFKISWYMFSVDFLHKSLRLFCCLGFVQRSGINIGLEIYSVKSSPVNNMHPLSPHLEICLWNYRRKTMRRAWNVYDMDQETKCQLIHVYLKTFLQAFLTLHHTSFRHVRILTLTYRKSSLYLILTTNGNK